MNIKKDLGSIIISDARNFNAQDIFECGQIFRYSATDEGYKVLSKDKSATVSKRNDDIVITTDDTDYFYNFFDLSTDYNAICDRLSMSNPIMNDSVAFGRGIRILNQDLTEMIFSFIISANNNIKRIQSIIERICAKLGKATPYGYAFPTVEALASVTPREYEELGCGYRAKYIYKTAQDLLNFDVNQLRHMDTSTARARLLNFMGVGPKVADCILLFGLHRSDTFPVDTWIKKVYHNYFETGLADNKISEYFLDTFGQDAGYAQQYLFYFQRKYRQSIENELK